MLCNCLRCRQESLPNQYALGLTGRPPIRSRAYLNILTWPLEKSSLFMEPSVNSGVLYERRMGRPSPGLGQGDFGEIDDRTQTRGTTKTNGNRGNPKSENQRKTGQAQPRGAGTSRTAASQLVRRCGAVSYTHL